MTVNNIKSYLKERTGYLKKGATALYDILVNQGFEVTVEDCSVALSEVRHEFKETAVSETTTNYYQITGDEPKHMPSFDLDKYKPVKIWGKDGSWSASYELKKEEDTSLKFIEDVKKN